MSIRDFEILAAMDAEDEAEARAQADAPPAKRRKGAVFVSRAHPEGRPDTGTYAKPEADDTAVMDEASFRRTVLFAYIAKFTREVAFKEKRRMAERVYIDTATDEQLTDRMRTYNKGVDREDFLELYRDKSNWTHFEFHGKPLVAILDIGEIVHPETTQLLGSFHAEKVTVSIERKKFQRSHLILLADKQEQPAGKTADHINPNFPLNDSVFNLRWATGSQQMINRIKNDSIRLNAYTIKCTKEHLDDMYFLSQKEAGLNFGVDQQTISKALITNRKIEGWLVRHANTYHGSVLPKHIVYGQIQLTDIGEYRTGLTGNNSAWRKALGDYTTITVSNKRKVKFHRLAIECVLGRNLLSGEEGDHVDGNPSNVNIKNIWLELRIINNIKRNQHFKVGLMGKFKYLFLSNTDAGKTVHVDQSDISAATHGILHTAGGFAWRIASVAELERIFDEVDKLALKSWDDIVAMLEEYHDHHYYELMRAQALLSKEYAEKLAAWRATLGQNAAA